MTIGRVLAKALRRTDPTVPVPPVDRPLRREVQRQRRPPYIYSPDEVKRLLDTARSVPSPHAPLRPLTLYTMIVLAYCAGLRLGEVVRLTLGDLDLSDETLDIRDTKFLQASAAAPGPQCCGGLARVPRSAPAGGRSRSSTTTSRAIPCSRTATAGGSPCASEQIASTTPWRH